VVGELGGVAMFSRIRYAAEVLSYSPPKVHPREQPDIVFQDEERCEITKTSLLIGTFIEILLVSTVIAFCSAPVMHFLFSGKPSASLLTITGFAASLLSIMGVRLFDKVNAHIRLQLKIGEKIAPYFGHKIVRTIQTLRG
jgi:hypothetical protein